jgi:hypothetical protein
LRHSRLKARDIIPGWPRGRSTSAEGRDRIIGLGMYRIRFLGNLKGFELFAEEVRLTRKYHEQQQAMVDEFRRSFGYQDAFTLRDASEGTFAVARWVVNRQETLEHIDRLIRHVLGTRTTGCFVVRVSDPPDSAPAPQEAGNSAWESFWESLDSDQQEKLLPGIALARAWFDIGGAWWRRRI